MEIARHNLSFTSKHTSSSSYLRREKLEVWQGDNPNRQQGEASSGQEVAPPPDASELIQPDRVETTTRSLKEGDETGKTEESGEKSPKTQEELELKILIESVSAILKETELTFKDPSLDNVQAAYEEGEKKIEDIRNRANTSERTRETNSEADWGLRYDSYQRYEEEEHLSFKAGGTVKTKDGKSIDFSVSLDMHRKFVQESETHIRAGNAEPIDPLVINYDGEAADLSEETFKFDLTMDGTLETLNTLEAGSGFLAMDKNGNGTIDDGSELFGPSTGNGFQELATYDQDGNRFIDEGDDAYEKLYVMTPGSNGESSRVKASELDVGAIFLGSSNTSFSFKKDLELQGQLRRSGIYLKENGEAGTVQQVDLVPEESENETNQPANFIDLSG